MNVCPGDIFWIAEPFSTKLGLVTRHHEPDYFPKGLVCCLQGQDCSEGSSRFDKIWLFNISSELLILSQQKLMVHRHKLDCLVKRLDCSVAVKVKVTGKVWNSGECSSGQCLLNCWIFCNQTWYSNASWARVSCKMTNVCVHIMFRVHQPLRKYKGSISFIHLLLLRYRSRQKTTDTQQAHMR